MLQVLRLCVIKDTNSYYFDILLGPIDFNQVPYMALVGVFESRNL